MIYTKKEVEDSILFFAKKYDKYNAYKALLDAHTILPNLADMIIKEMFINEYCYYTTVDNEEWDSYRAILQYSQELSRIGYVNFL